MVESGYNYMKREHFEGRLPIAKQPLPNFVNIPTAVSVKSNMLKTGRVANLDSYLETSNSTVSRFNNIKGYALSSWKWLSTGLTATALTTSASEFRIPMSFELPDAYTVSKAIESFGSIIPH
jgi:hypothetical protein